MPKFTLALVMAMLAVAVQGHPTRENDIATAAAAGNWNEVQRLLSDSIKEKYSLSPIISTDVRSLRPEQGGHVYGEAEYTFHTATNVNGKTNEQSGGHKVINNDGKVMEYDFKP